MRRYYFLPLGAWLWVLLLLAPAERAQAVINAGLQPYDLFTSRYSRALVLEVSEVDPSSGLLKTSVVKTYKGAPEQETEVSIQFDASLLGVLADALSDGDFQQGDPIVVFAGRKRAKKDFMLYANSFYLGKIQGPGNWTIDRTGQGAVGMSGEQLNTLAGTWNGSTPQLVRMLEDMATGIDFFPRKAYVQFKDDILLDRLESGITAIAVFDIEGDGDEDIVACSAAGDRVYLQTDPMVFIDATEGLGVASSSTSVALADYNGDGLNDLLAGTDLYQGHFQDNRFHFVKTELLPERSTSKLKTATFCDINGDGFPDILASFVDKGIEIYLNPADAEKKFVDATESMGLNRPETGAGSDAYVTPGDWNGDGLMDLFLAAGDGYLLIQDQDGRFTPKPHEIEFKFTVGADNETGITGAGVFMPIVQSEALDLVVPMEESWLVIANNDGRPEDVTRWGNEISEGSNDHLSTIGADLNLDGYMDLFTVSRAPNGHNRFIINRGYGSFMLAPVHRHYEYVFRGPSSERGGLSSAAGDLNDDGAPDLVVGNSHGDITLIINDTLQARSPIEFPPREIKILEGTHLLQVRVLGTKGVTNARLRLIDKADVVIARRDLGSNVAGGSFGPNRVSFAVRRPDVFTLEVRYSDGLIQQKEVDLTEEQYVSINIDRGEDLSQGVW